MLKDKTIILGITGSIAAYKAADIASRLTKEGAKVEVVMTKAATWFIAPLALSSITGRGVFTDVFGPDSERTVEHINLAEAADAVVIAPATASLIAKLAAGIADEMPALVVLATKAPIVLAPAMHTNMYLNSITQENLAKLRARGFTVVEPESGRLASGGVGPGRLANSDKIMGTIKKVLERKSDLAGKKLVVTAGGTREPIDPVRHITNPSSGKMGYAIAEAARDRGAEVKLVTAPTSLAQPVGVEVIAVKTTLEMQKAVAKAVTKADVLIMAAAVTDYQPKTTAKAKIKKDEAELRLELVRTPDILAEAKGDFIKVGFAAESNDIIANAKKKLKNKKLDIIVANDITAADSGFGVDTNRVIIIDKKGGVEELPLMSKREVADKILDGVMGLVKD